MFLEIHISREVAASVIKKLKDILGMSTKEDTVTVGRRGQLCSSQFQSSWQSLCGVMFTCVRAS